MIYRVSVDVMYSSSGVDALMYEKKSVACGMWHVACGMWHVACGMWHHQKLEHRVYVEREIS
jgi:hypothetical protein